MSKSTWQKKSAWDPGSQDPAYYAGLLNALFQAEEITNLKKQLNLIYVKHTGQELQTIHDSLERDKFMNPQQALEFGLIDKVLEHPPKAGAEADKKE